MMGTLSLVESIMSCHNHTVSLLRGPTLKTILVLMYVNTQYVMTKTCCISNKNGLILVSL